MPSESRQLGDLIRAQDQIVRLRLEKLRMKLDCASLQHRVDQVEQSAAFRLGNALLDVVRMPGGILGFPRKLGDVIRLVGSRPPVAAAAVVDPADLIENELSDLHHQPALKTASAPPGRIGGLRIAAVMDEFTAACFAPDCHLLSLPSTGFEEVLDGFSPHLLFVESAWRANGGQWKQKVYPLSAELIHLIACCRRRGIPTVFWNKEDPSHFSRFIRTARWFDFVFTTDADCVERYREALGHGRVHLLSFACQPRIHNPVETGPRREAASFAGSWYRQYPERSRDFERMVDTISKIMPVEIYDRNSTRGDPAFAFPERFASMLRPAVPYERMAEVYKGYIVGLTVNTVKSSPSMFARRICELLASNTVVVTNSSDGVRHTFGDLVLYDDSADFVPELSRICRSPAELHRRRLRGLRAVLSHHCASHRLAAVASIALGCELEPERPLVVALARARVPAEAKLLSETYRRQQWPHKKLLLVIPDDMGTCVPEAEDLAIVRERDLAGRQLVLGSSAPWFAMLHPADHYGNHYLTDLALATSYSGGLAVGKDRTFIWDEVAGPVAMEGSVHREADLALRCALVPSSVCAEEGAQTWLNRMEADSMRLRGIAIDEFNYCRGGAGRDVLEVDE